MNFAILLPAFVTIHLVALSLCASPLQRTDFRSPLFGTTFALIIIEGLCVASPVLGAYTESRWNITARLRGMLLQAGRDALARPANLELCIVSDDHEYFVEPAVAMFKSKLQTK